MVSFNLVSGYIELFFLQISEPSRFLDKKVHEQKAKETYESVQPQTPTDAHITLDLVIKSHGDLESEEKLGCHAETRSLIHCNLRDVKPRH